MNLWITAILVLALALASCGKPSLGGKAEAGHGHHEEEGAGKTHFEKGRGLKLSHESLEAMGVKTEDVGERLLTIEWSSQAQIYRSAEEKSSVRGGFRSGFAYASAPIPASASGLVGRGNRVIVRMVGGGEQHARLMRVDDSLRAATETVEALLEIPDPSHSLPVGSFVQAEFSSGPGRNVMAIPASALLRTAEGRFVYVKNGGHLLRTTVQVAAGSSPSGWVEVTDGLLPGDVIAVTGVEALHLTELRATKGGGHCH